VIVEPPFDAGAVKVTEAVPLPAVAVPIVGACEAVVAVVAGELEADAVELPLAFLAVTV
jgi:hypothetical protein